LDTVSTTCGSGWVRRRLHLARLRLHPPATAGGTDCIQVSPCRLRTHPLPQVVLTVSKYQPCRLRTHPLPQVVLTVSKYQPCRLRTHPLPQVVL